MEDFNEIEDSEKLIESEQDDEDIVKDILDQLKPNKDETSEADLEKLLNRYEKNKNDAIVEDKIEHLNRPTETVVELTRLDLNRFDANLLRGFRQIQYLYLQDNRISSLQIDFFTILNRLKYLDLRNNALVTLPCSICYHECLEILLLQGNCMTRVPKEIGSLPKLRGLQLSQNPITYPASSVLSRGSSAIIEYLRLEWAQYERETGQARQNRNGGGALATAHSVQIRAKQIKRDETTSAGSEKRNGENKKRAPKKLTSRTQQISGDEESKTVITLGSDKTSLTLSGVERGKCESKIDHIDYKPDPVCMFVNKIKPGKTRKEVNLPYCTDETQDTWSTSNQSFSGSVTEISPQSSTPSPQSSTTSRKKHIRKMKHYSEILNPYKPFGSVRQSLDDQQIQALYLRRLIEIHMKFIAANKEKQLQRMKNRESLDKWRDEYTLHMCYY
uniref:Leucine-rich repeat-containing protein 27 n=1 Tax=Cacopsylla melanoneura TaxID=428564 RepID=A0A8D9DWA4_9HEMI